MIDDVTRGLLDKDFAGIDVNTVGDEPEMPEKEVWNRVPNRRIRRQYSRLHGVENPRRSRCSRKKGR